MLVEIISLVILCKNIGLKVAAKGRVKLPYQLMVVAFFFGGEFAGAIIGAISDLIVTNGRQTSFLFAYVFALFGAGVGAFIAFRIANALPSIVAYADPGDEYDRHFHETRGNQGPHQSPLPPNTDIVGDLTQRDDRIHE
jgi:hypothetical protein